MFMFEFEYEKHKFKEMLVREMAVLLTLRIHLTQDYEGGICRSRWM